MNTTTAATGIRSRIDDGLPGGIVAVAVQAQVSVSGSAAADGTAVSFSMPGGSFSPVVAVNRPIAAAVVSRRFASALPRRWCSAKNFFIDRQPALV